MLLRDNPAKLTKGANVTFFDKQLPGINITISAGLGLVSIFFFFYFHSPAYSPALNI
jgi:hypothetical protein